MVIRIQALLSSLLILLALIAPPAFAENEAGSGAARGLARGGGQKAAPVYSEMWAWDASKGAERDRMSDHEECRVVGDGYKEGVLRLGGYRGCMTYRGWVYTGD